MLALIRHYEQFQSTLSVRRATHRWWRRDSAQPISIHALREESDLSEFGCGNLGAISIHALREESDILTTPVMRSH